MFEYFQVKDLFISLHFLLSMYSSGRTTGLSVDIGEGLTTVAPIVEGFPQNHAIKKVFYSGKGVT